MLNHTQLLKINRLSAWYDLVVTWPFATPLTLFWAWSATNAVHGALGLPPLPAFTPFGVLFGNFFGTVVLIWSAVRLRLGDPQLARFDAIGRWLFSLWMLNALLAGASPLLWGLIVVELSFAALQSLPMRRNLADRPIL